MINKHLVLSDGTSVSISDSQIAILGTNEADAAERIEHIRTMQEAVAKAVESLTSLHDRPELFYQQTMVASGGHKASDLVKRMSLRNAHKIKWNDPDIEIVRNWMRSE